MTDLPVIVPLAFTDEGLTFTGQSAAEIVRDLHELAPAALGANCTVGPSTLLDVLEQVRRAVGDLPLSRRDAGAYVMPSFGRFEVAVDVIDAAAL